MCCRALEGKKGGERVEVSVVSRSGGAEKGGFGNLRVEHEAV